MKKYELTNNVHIVDGKTLYRIKALKDFDTIKAGYLGGFIESESNLSHDGNCWISGNACVHGNARVYGSARVLDNACVSGNSFIYGTAMVFDNAKVYDNAILYGNAKVYGNAQVFGNAHVYGSANLNRRAFINSSDDIFWISNVGSENGTLTAFKTDSGNIYCTRGCFCGALDEFIDAVNKKDDSDKSKLFYLNHVIPMIKYKFDVN